MHHSLSTGPALHGYYLHRHTSDNAPATLTDGWLEAFLNHMPNRRGMPEMSPAFLKVTRFCWDYLHALLDETDAYCLEPQLAGLSPDIVALHRRRLYVIETKAASLNQTTKRYQLGKARRQVEAGVSHLRHMTKGRVEVYGFILVFRFASPDQLPEPEWKPVCHYPAHPPA